MSRILEEPVTAKIKLQAFLTVQGGGRRFQYLQIEKSGGERIFSFGEAPALNKAPLAAGADRGHYFDPRTHTVYAVFAEPVWLGRQHGMGRMTFFFQVDNAILRALAAPETTLTLLHDAVAVASSAGQRGIDAFHANKATGSDSERSTIQWTGVADASLRLVLDAPLAPLFSPLELVAGVSLVPLLDGAILWFALGTWLMVQARRIRHLGGAVDEFATQQACTPRFYEQLQVAGNATADEIRHVAEAMQAAAEQSVDRETRLTSEVTQRRLWSSVFQDSREALIITDAQANMVAVNPAFESIFGFTQEDVRGRNPRMLSASREDLAFYERMWQTLGQQGFWQSELRATHKNGSEHFNLVSISTVKNARGEIENFIGFYADISERKRTEAELAVHRHNLETMVQERTRELEEANSELARLAATDPLTGLFNRRTLLDRGEQCHLSAQRYGTTYALTIIDIDHFKAINDRCGHDAGDKVLQAVAERIQGELRDTDTLARWGGEEFVVLSPQNTAHDVRLLAERLRTRIATEPIDPAGTVTASFGVAGHMAGDTLTTVIKHADDNLYTAKRAGRNRVCGGED